jgi:hypothetical protein
MRNLFQNAGISLARLGWAEDSYRNIDSNFSSANTLDLVHGKDLIAAISWRFDVSFEESERAILAALSESRDRMSILPQYSSARDYVLQ